MKVTGLNKFGEMMHFMLSLDSVLASGHPEVIGRRLGNCEGRQPLETR